MLVKAKYLHFIHLYKLFNCDCEIGSESAIAFYYNFLSLVYLLVNRFDFFLVSQHVRQGTVTPTHYVVVHDDTGMMPDHIQRYFT